MELTDQIRIMAKRVARGAAQRSSLNRDDVEQELLVLAWREVEDTDAALLCCKMKRRAIDLARSAASGLKMRYLPHETLGRRCVPGKESDVVADDFAEAFRATLTPKMREACDAIKETSDLTEAAKLCGVTHGAMRAMKMKIQRRLAEFMELQ